MPSPFSRLRPAAALLVPLLAAVLLGLATSPAAFHAAAALPPSAWADKHNPLNSYLAKLAWGWTSALFVAALAVCAPTRAPAASALHAARYALASLYWVAMVRWFFGPPLLDRLFVLTGGSCLIDHADSAPSISSLGACRTAGGRWAGGHDVSGHCFLLLHSALFLAEEVLSPLLALPPAPSPSAIIIVRRTVAAAAAALICVWAVMLFFTAKYFHGAAELLSGSLVGVGYWAPLYQLARLLGQ
ncbi:hypothetical protein EV175_002960 [Coemansia sp. RSA 1933]|nr:hypothetical protein EV175_002960 [Coemansia sp. RSA 1933]